MLHLTNKKEEAILPDLQGILAIRKEFASAYHRIPYHISLSSYQDPDQESKDPDPNSAVRKVFFRNMKALVNIFAFNFVEI